MRTNIDLDDQLVAEAFKASGAATKKELVHLGLKALIKSKKRLDLLDLVGVIDLDPDFDHKAVRRTKSDAR